MTAMAHIDWFVVPVWHVVLENVEF